MGGEGHPMTGKGAEQENVSGRPSPFRHERHAKPTPVECAVRVGPSLLIQLQS